MFKQITKAIAVLAVVGGVSPAMANDMPACIEQLQNEINPILARYGSNMPQAIETAWQQQSIEALKAYQNGDVDSACGIMAAVRDFLEDHAPR
ncbi:MAG TPA: hypothetical protein VK196_02875 [Magnetospirillum sp.]|nr:hypothetical protein [Magnetospirillum sp.]